MFPDSNAEETRQRAGGLDALEALANEHRIAILRALADADDPLTFTELREAIDMADTGQFNYHLTQLLGRFVRERQGGYELGHAGERLIVLANDIDPETVANSRAEYSTGPCPVCGEANCDKVVHVHLSSEAGKQ